MRLLPAGDNVYEVHENNRLVGKVWLHLNDWRAEMKDGTPVVGPFDTARKAANAVVYEHRRR